MKSYNIPTFLILVLTQVPRVTPARAAYFYLKFRGICLTGEVRD